MTKKELLIGGSGFAGTWAAISAARVLSLAGKQDEVDITVVSPAPNLLVRPRLYETAFKAMTPELLPLFSALGVRHIAGWVETLDAKQRSVAVTTADGSRRTLTYDKFILATGSQLYLPDLPGLRQHAFDIDSLDGARKLDAHLRSLAGKPNTPGRNTLVVAGGGFTGIELAAELPERLRGYLGADASPRVVILEQADAVGPDLGPVPRPVIEQALTEVGVEIMTSAGVAVVEPHQVITADGRRVATETVVWTAGMRANGLAAQIPGQRDRLGRVLVDEFLRAPSASGIFVTGDTAHAATDDEGHVASMSCQHALSLGRVAGHNAAAELIGSALHRYRQVPYVTCLDIGPWGALFTEGWDRQVKLTRAEGKALKRDINTKWIYPPAASREAAFETAKPDHPIVA
jgi:NADH dehydrogenase